MENILINYNEHSEVGGGVGHVKGAGASSHGSKVHSPSSCGNSSQRMATEVLMPWKTDTVKDAPMARPSMKLWRPSLRVIIQARVPISE